MLKIYIQGVYTDELKPSVQFGTFYHMLTQKKIRIVFDNVTGPR